MPAPIDFCFDFWSPHGYLASKRIVRDAALAGEAVPALCRALFADHIDISEAIADGERFRGMHRLGQAERWLATGGW